MEVYNKVENDAGDGYWHDATTTGTMGYKHGELDHNMQMVCHMEEEKNAERSKLIVIEVF